MLDFGTEMDPPEDREFDNDLFTEQPPEKPEVQYEKDAEKSPAPAPAPEPEKRRSPVKPPVLPQYKSKEKKKAERIKPELRNNPHFLHRDRKSEEFSVEDKMEVSRILKDARKAAGLTPEDVENSCAIRSRYLIALEEGNYDELPRPVYVLAFLRKLCQLYDIPEEEENLLIRPWRDIPFELPENLSSIQQDEDNSGRTKILHMLEIALLGLGAIIVLGIVVLVIVLISSHISGKDVEEPVFDNTKLLELQQKPSLQLPKQ